VSDPKDKGAKPPYPQQKQPMPGSEQEMEPKADHGEHSYKGYGRLAGKAALITGGDSGIGRATAIAFAREGADVAIVYLPPEEQDAKQTERWVREAGRRALLLPGDITNEQQCTEMVERTFREFGKLDILVNNAAFQSTHDTIEEFTTEEFDRTMKTNIYAMFWLCKAALPRMQEGANIINVASIQAYRPTPMLLAYAPTKAAIVNFTKALGQMAMKRGVRVNAVAPGPVWTPLIPSTMPDEKTKNFGKDTAFERPAQPAEIAPLFVFLASEESRYMAGEVLAVTGGQTPF
jgi:NAD(P)-dependent dehydrogenase (short-subunit alcohol dehydrogenase family)